MPRQKRINLPGSLFHVISRGIERRKIFLDEKDREKFLDRFEISLKKSGYQCYAWALLPNHFHFLLRSSDAPLSALMRSLMTGYAGYFNRRHKRRGVLFQNRFKSILCQEDAYLLELVRYIHLNPVRAKIVCNLKGLEKYPWTGHSSIYGKKKREFQENDEVLSLFGTEPRKARSSYLNFMLDGMSMGKQPNLTGGGLRRSAGGWVGVEALKKAKEYWYGDDRILGDSDFVTHALNAFEEELDRKESLKREGWNLKKLSHEVCEIFLVSQKQLKEKGRANNISQAKASIAFLGTKELGIKRREISDFLGISPSSVSYLIRIGERLENEDVGKLFN